MSLRPYQIAALEAVRATYQKGHRSVLVVMPTGTGKTVLFAEIARLAKGPVLVLAHRQELIEQARQKISAWIDDVVAVEMGQRRDRVLPASVPDGRHRGPYRCPCSHHRTARYRCSQTNKHSNKQA